MNALEIIFWIALFVVFYTYIGYGILLYILVKLKEAFKKKCDIPCPVDDKLPHVTLYITAIKLGVPPPK